MVQYRRNQKQKLRKRSRKTNRNNQASIWNTNVKPYRKFDQLAPDEKNFIYQYVSTPDNEREDLNIQLAKMKNKDEIWYNIWHQQRDSNNFPQGVTIVETKPTNSQIPTQLYFKDFDTDKKMIDYQNKFYNDTGIFDFTEPFIGYSSINSYMDLYHLTIDDLHKLFEQYYNNK